MPRFLKPQTKGPGRLAVDLAGWALHWLEGYQDWNNESAEHYATNSGKDYDEILSMLQYFEKLGWTHQDSRGEILSEMRDRVAKNDFEPGDMVWARGVLAKWDTEAVAVAA